MKIHVLKYKDREVARMCPLNESAAMTGAFVALARTVNQTVANPDDVIITVRNATPEEEMQIRGLTPIKPAA